MTALMKPLAKPPVQDEPYSTSSVPLGEPVCQLRAEHLSKSYGGRQVLRDTHLLCLATSLGIQRSLPAKGIQVRFDAPRPFDDRSRLFIQNCDEESDRMNSTDRVPGLFG